MSAGGRRIAGASDFALGPVQVRPSQRLIEGPYGSRALEPLVLKLLLLLSDAAGQLIPRRAIFDALWGATAVGEDSLNRTVAVLRKALLETAGEVVKVETVPAAGYVLRLLPAQAGGLSALNIEEEVARILGAAFDSWRLALPQPDHISLEQLRRACTLAPGNARCWGFLALLARHAAEYDRAAAAAAHVAECERAAQRAIGIDPNQPEARTALVSVVPLFGGWTAARAALEAIVAESPSAPVPLQDLATLEMSAGRVRNGKAIRDRLVAADPLAAGLCYKSVYQHWAVGDLQGMDHVAERAMQLWPSHPAVWAVRFWTLAYTQRAPAALQMLDDPARGPTLPGSMSIFLRQVMLAALEGVPQTVDAAVKMSLSAAGTGPANAIAAMFALGLLDRHDEAFAVAEAYYLLRGDVPVPTRHTDAELSLNEQHRRLTQVLFMPVFQKMRDDARFLSICDRIGLSRHWEETGLAPDFLS